jgi:hypothetical protein
LSKGHIVSECLEPTIISVIRMTTRSQIIIRTTMSRIISARRVSRAIQKSIRPLSVYTRSLIDPEFARAIGRHGELMFDAALGRFGFRAEAKDANSWNDRIWRETNHNPDRIITRDGLVYGVEIKNTQNYISREELRLKIRLCQYLNLIPLFIMRFAPKSYMYEIIQSGGFGLLFEEQIYPFGHTALLNEARKNLLLKVRSPRDVKEGDMQRLLNWHTKLARR